MLIHKDENHKGVLRNFLSVIYSDRGTFYLFLHIENSRTISEDQDFPECSAVLQYSILECSTKFYSILLENSSTFEKVPD